ncbi:MAG: hypothetical protein AAFV78_19360 [Bacteroidota bacterium]
MIDFKSTWVNFAPTRGRKQRKSGSVTFSKPVQSANAAIKGLRIGYTNGDHHIYQLETDIDMGSIEGAKVNFNVDFLLRDSSGLIDDPYNGWVEVLVIADLE